MTLTMWVSMRRTLTRRTGTYACVKKNEDIPGLQQASDLFVLAFDCMQILDPPRTQ